MNYQYIAELTKLLGICKLIMAKASDNYFTMLSYKDAYGMIFSDKIAGRVFYITNQIGNKLDYDDPDGSYEDDCLSFVNALEYHMRNIEETWTPYDIRKLFEALPEQEE